MTAKDKAKELHIMFLHQTKGIFGRKKRATNAAVLCVKEIMNYGLTNRIDSYESIKRDKEFKYYFNNVMKEMEKIGA